MNEAPAAGQPEPVPAWDRDAVGVTYVYAAIAGHLAMRIRAGDSRPGEDCQASASCPRSTASASARSAEHSTSCANAGCSPHCPRKAPSLPGRYPATSSHENAAELLPVPDPVPRDGERALARWGCSARAPARCSPRVPGTRWAGRLLALPALEGTGLVEAARQVYGRRRDGYPGRTSDRRSASGRSPAALPARGGTTRQIRKGQWPR